VDKVWQKSPARRLAELVHASMNQAQKRFQEWFWGRAAFGRAESPLEHIVGAAESRALSKLSN